MEDGSLPMKELREGRYHPAVDSDVVAKCTDRVADIPTAPVVTVDNLLDLLILIH